MRIVIDVSPIIYETGVSTYTDQLVRNLLEIDTKNKYVLYGGSMRRLTDLKIKTQHFSDNAKLRLFPIPPTIAELVWNRLHIFPIEALVGKADVFHSSDWYQPPSRAFKVTTIHDLAPILHPHLTPKKIVEAHKRRLEWVKREVDRVIVPTESGKNDLADFGINKEKIRVIPEAADPAFKRVDEDTVKKIRKRLNINEKYLLTVGVGGRKNTNNLIKAVKRLKDYQLVVVGRKPDNFHETNDINIIFTGHINKNQLIALYSGALVLVYPSLYEGFGLPVLEAFACGCPVVTSNIPVLSEVSGSSAILVDPNDIQSIESGIKKAISKRETLITKGFDRLKQFSWTETAQMTLDVYQEL